MKTEIMICTILLLLSAFTGIVFGGTEGTMNTFYGTGTGASTTGDDDYDTFIGAYAGFNNTTGSNNTIGSNNTSLGFATGYNNITGSGNIFLGYTAGYDETGSNKLYIDNSDTSAPLIYGEFGNRILTINGNLEVIGPYQGLVYLSNTTADNTDKGSRMVLNHYSNAQLPVYLFGVYSGLTDNFVAFGGGALIGNAATQLDLFTAPNTTTPAGYPRLTIIGNGYVGIGTQTPSYPLQMAGGAYTDGTDWFSASSQEYKEEIEALSTREALEAIQELNPVKYAYKTNRAEKRVGFIAEDVPDLVATQDWKGLSPIDIVAVLAKVVQEQQKTISTLREELNELKGKVR